MTTTEPVDYQRFTAAGRPFPSAPSVASSTGISAALGGQSGMLGTQSMLPHRFKDTSIILVPIRLSDLFDPDEDFEAWWGSIKKDSGAKKRRFSFSRISLFKPITGAGKGEFVTVEMTRADYIRYYAKDEKGQYIGTEPQSVSRAALKEMIARQNGGRSASTASMQGSYLGAPEIQSERAYDRRFSHA